MITRFVLLRHEVPPDFPRGSHWDLLLEREELCWTWAMEALPGKLAGSDAANQVDAHRLKDHRKHYLEYEGPVSGDRGNVSRVLAGQCRWLEVDVERVRVLLQFNTNACTLLLEKIGNEQWQLTVP